MGGRRRVVDGRRILLLPTFADFGIWYGGKGKRKYHHHQQQSINQWTTLMPTTSVIA
jgi:hypothetical protein